MTENTLIHVAQITIAKKGKSQLFLRKQKPGHYRWFIENSDAVEKETAVIGETPEEALKNANRQWKLQEFRTINCGFRYTLPERDEHGCNALFHQMAASYSTSTGVYFEEELGHNCYVQGASQEALNLWRTLQAQSRL